MLRLTCTRYVSRNLQQMILNTRLLASTSNLLNGNDNREKRGMKLLAEEKDLTEVCKESSPNTSTMTTVEVIREVETLIDAQEPDINEPVENRPVSSAKEKKKNWKSKRKRKTSGSLDANELSKHVENIDLSAEGSVEKLKILIDMFDTNAQNEENNNKDTKNSADLDANIISEDKKTSKVSLNASKNEKSNFLEKFLNENPPEPVSNEPDSMKVVSNEIKTEDGGNTNVNMLSQEENVRDDNISLKLAEILNLSNKTTKKSVRKNKMESDKIPMAEKLKMFQLGQSQDNKKVQSSEKSQSKKSYNKNRKPTINLQKGLSTELFSGDSFEMGDFSYSGDSLYENQWFHKLEKLKTQASTKDINPNSFEVLQMNIEKQWVFPIDNEQNIGVEETIGFEDHVFLDDYLSEFPNIDSIQKYMELVIVGLQQNPYMSVEEKRTRILWHKEYFDSIPDDDIVSFAS